MARVFALDGLTPVVHPSSFAHPTAVLIGDVIVGRNCYIGPNAVMRGDIGRLVMEDGANLQDNCVVHCFPGRETVIEENGHIGHGRRPAWVSGRAQRSGRHECGRHGRRRHWRGKFRCRPGLREGGL